MTTDKPCAANLMVARRPGNWSQKIDIALDVSVGALKTMNDVANIFAVPFLSNAASIVLSIVDVVQRVRSNKREFKELTNDSCEIVCDIIDAYKDAPQPGDVPIDLKHLEQLVNDLLSIMAFARKGASRNFFVAMLRSNADAQQIQDYQKKLYQAIHIFRLHSDITLRKTVAQLADQVAIANQLNSITVPALQLPILSPCVLPSPLSFSDGLRGAPQNDTSKMVNLRTLPHSENILGISKQVMNRQDNVFMQSRAKHGIVARSLVRSSSPPASLIKSTQAQTMHEQYKATANPS